jgi:hypothetical protein
MQIFATVFALAALTVSAQAGVLPIDGSYCNQGTGDLGGAGVIVDTDGIHSEDDSAFAKIVKSGSNWWVVTYNNEPNDFMKGVTSRIERSPDGNKLTIVDSDMEVPPYTLHRCLAARPDETHSSIAPPSQFTAAVTPKKIPHVAPPKMTPYYAPPLPFISTDLSRIPGIVVWRQ